MASQEETLIDGPAHPGRFHVYEHFIRRQDMEGMADLLVAGGIAVRRSTNGLRQWREKIIVGSTLQPEFYLEIPNNEFAKANYLIREAAEEAWAGSAVDRHPFAGYDDHALRAILDDEAHYGIEATVVARNLLLRRGLELELRPIREKFRQSERSKAQGKTASILSLSFTLALGLVSAVFLQPITFLVAAGLAVNFGWGTIRTTTGTAHFRYAALTRVRGKGLAAVLAGALAFGLVNALYGGWITAPAIRTWWWFWR